jgi:hypothetical protein
MRERGSPDFGRRDLHQERRLARQAASSTPGVKVERQRRRVGAPTGQLGQDSQVPFI